MKLETKILFALIALIAYAFYTAVDVFAAPNTTTAVNNAKAQDLTPETIQPKPAQSCKAHETCTTIAAMPETQKPICFVNGKGKIVCHAPRNRINQDLTQCVLSTVGNQILCVDTCGGRSEPGTACTPE